MMNQGPGDTDFSKLPNEVVLHILHFVKEEQKLHELRTISHYFNTIITTETLLLNTVQIQSELQHPIYTAEDKDMLWRSQQEEFDYLLSKQENILKANKILLSSIDFDELKSLSKELLSVYNLYKRHKALNHINHKMILAKINPSSDKLDCKNAFLTRCPRSIFTVPHLQIFWQQLKHFNFSGNRLKSLPLSAMTLPQLTWLNLANNHLQQLGDITGLQSLKWLYLNNNFLTNLPPTLTQLKSLTSLDVQHNQIETLPEDFNQLKALIEFNAQYNCLSQLPASFGLSLQLMPDLRYNLLTELPDTLQEKMLVNSETAASISKNDLLSTQIKKKECMLSV